MKSIDRLNHPPQELHPGAHPSEAVPFLGTTAVNAQEALGLYFILVKHFERTYRDLVGGIAKHSPKIWLGIVPGCSVSDLEGEDFSHVLFTGFALLLWSQLPPPHTESFKSPSLGFQFPCPAMLDGSTSSVTWDLLSYQSGERGGLRKSRGIEEEELSPALISAVSPREILPWVRKDSKTLFCCAKNCIWHSKALCDHYTRVKQDWTLPRNMLPPQKRRQQPWRTPHQSVWVSRAKL